MDNNKLAQQIAKEYLRGLKLTGTLDNLGLDTSDFRLRLFDPMLELMGITEESDKIVDIVEKYEKKVVELSYFEFIENGLEKLTEEMLEEIKNIERN